MIPILKLNGSTPAHLLCLLIAHSLKLSFTQSVGTCFYLPSFLFNIRRYCFRLACRWICKYERHYSTDTSVGVWWATAMSLPMLRGITVVKCLLHFSSARHVPAQASPSGEKYGFEFLLFEFLHQYLDAIHTFGERLCKSGPYRSPTAKNCSQIVVRFFLITF